MSLKKAVVVLLAVLMLVFLFNRLAMARTKAHPWEGLRPGLVAPDMEHPWDELLPPATDKNSEHPWQH